MVSERYTRGSYLEKNPSWHAEDSEWKALQVLKMLNRRGLKPASVCEIGCGAGEILRQLQARMDGNVVFKGFEISPQALELCKTRANDRLQFEQGDGLARKDEHFDLILALDLIEHLEDYFAFLRAVKSRGEWKIFHVPLELSVQTVLRSSPLLKSREAYGHLHHFTRETALAALAEAGYELADEFYTLWSLELPAKTFKSALLRIPRQIGFRLNQDLAARVIGGCSLMAMAR